MFENGFGHDPKWQVFFRNIFVINLKIFYIFRFLSFVSASTDFDEILKHMCWNKSINLKYTVDINLQNVCFKFLLQAQVKTVFIFFSFKKFFLHVILLVISFYLLKKKIQIFSNIKKLIRILIDRFIF